MAAESHRQPPVISSDPQPKPILPVATETIQSVHAQATIGWMSLFTPHHLRDAIFEEWADPLEPQLRAKAAGSLAEADGLRAKVEALRALSDDSRVHVMVAMNAQMNSDGSAVAPP